MCYTQAPATTMMATHCAFCGRPLVDAQSVETGVGPVCRDKYLVGEALPADSRQEANRLIHRIAQIHKSSNPEAKREVLLHLARLQSLGFSKGAARIRKRMRKRLRKQQVQATQPIKITREGDRLVVSTPYRRAFVNGARQVDGRRWDRERKVNTFPVQSKRQVWHLLQKHFSGQPARGPKGAFTL